MNRADGVKRLVTILEAEERLYLEMRDLLQTERELILSLDATGLEQAVREKSALADEGRLLEESREEVARELAFLLEVETARPTLSEITSALGEEDCGLRQAHSKLAALVGAVKELLDANAGFAGNAREQVQATLQLLGRMLPDDPTYGPSGPGVPRAVHSAGRLVQRTA